jgi:hypothetical protein
VPLPAAMMAMANSLKTIEEYGLMCEQTYWLLS